MREGLLLLLLLVTCTSTAVRPIVVVDVKVKGDVVNETVVKPEGTFYLGVELTGDTCDKKLSFYIDEEEFHSEELACGAKFVRTPSWSLSVKPLSCGLHNLSVVVTEDEKVLQSYELNLSVGKVPRVKLSPERPLVREKNTFSLFDPETRKPLKGLRVEFYSDGKFVNYDLTDSMGRASVTFDEPGSYSLKLRGDTYCLDFGFQAKKRPVVRGPEPSEPVVGDLVAFSVPLLVGVKCLYPTGELKPLINIEGKVSFTPTLAGNYTLIVAEHSINYWPERVSFLVREKLPLEVLAPERLVVGAKAEFLVTSAGKPVEGAGLRVTKPDGSEVTLLTDPKGVASFTPSLLGTYTIRVEKERYLPKSLKLEAANSLSCGLPEKILAGKPFLLRCIDHFGNGVFEAIIKVDGLKTLTGLEGAAELSLEEPGTYKLLASKHGFWSYEAELIVKGYLQLRLSTNETKAGEMISVEVLDHLGKAREEAELSVEGPLNFSLGSNRTFVVDVPGIYRLRAKLLGYEEGASELLVRPRPVRLEVNLPDARSPKLSVRVTSEEGPVAGLLVSLRGPERTLENTTDAEGLVSFEVEPTSYELVVNPGGANVVYEEQSLKVVVKKGLNTLVLLASMVFISIAAWAVVRLVMPAMKR